ncbi:MAG: bifunctional riboflavin kinase/FAD synthetase [Chloroflexi bacterium]|nr:bifunctional riboflavin kinase/FAD synthetase [Chloroflexota bacterium]
MRLPEGAQWFDQLHVTCETVLTIGVLDGVHLGHQALLKQVGERARHINACSGVLTFSPHPQEVVTPGIEIPHLTTLEDRVRLIRDQGVDIVSALHFTRELSRMSPAEFIDLLLERIRMVELWVGPDFSLGYRRSGTVQVLAAIGKTKGFTVNTIPPFELDGRVVSSTEIRRLVSAGQVREAARLLGRSHYMVGKVIHGVQRGRTIGVPTANLEVSRNLVTPADGVYAVYVYVDEQRWNGVLSIGKRPTFDDDGRRSIETHIIDFDGDLYGRQLRVEFVERLRAEVRFSDVRQLVRQIHADVEQARAVLGVMHY